MVSIETQLEKNFMRLILFSLTFLGLAACAQPTMRSAVAKSFGKKLKVSEVKTLCKMPPGAPITETLVFLGCSADGIPVVLDLICQKQKTITASCSYRIEGFKSLKKTAGKTPATPATP